MRDRHTDVRDHYTFLVVCDMRNVMVMRFIDMLLVQLFYFVG